VRRLRPALFLSALFLVVPAVSAGADQGTPSLTGSASGGGPAAPVPNGVATPLYSQLDNASTTSITSQNFEAANDAFDNQAADDFVVPAGQSWDVTSLEIPGQYFNGTGPAGSVNVSLWTNATSLPGTQVFALDNAVITSGASSGNFSVRVNPPATLTPGRYWLSVQANMDFATGGQWGWIERNVQTGRASAWRNPANGFGTGCTGWTKRTDCNVGTQPDLAFAIFGSSRACTITGTAFDDNGLIGTSGADTICAGLGDDVVDAAAGADKVYLGDGNDKATGGTGNDDLFGEYGGDTLIGKAGNDDLFGARGPDTLKTTDGVSGNDSGNGGPNPDTCTGDPGDVFTNC
jgi:Ca2+-binding RTX toxin-like protein